MKASKKLALAVSAVSVVVFSGSVLAQNLVVKANNTNPLNDPASWAGNVVPGLADAATFDATLAGANTFVLGGNVAWGGIRYGSATTGSPASDQVISNTGGGTLSLDQYGIDMGSATTNLTMTLPVNLTAAQTWNVPVSRTLTINGLVSTGANAYTRSGTGTVVYAGGLATTASTLAFNNGGLNTIVGNMTISNPLNWSVNTTSGTNQATSLTGTLALTGSTVVTKSGSLTLNVGAASFPVTTSVPFDATGGTLNITSAPFTMVGDTTVTATGGTINFGGLVTNGANKIVKAGAGTFNFTSGVSNFNDLTQVNVVAGTLGLNQPSTVVFSTPQTWTMGAGATLNINAQVDTGGVSITKIGQGAISIGNGTSAWTGGAAATLTVNEGTLTLNGTRVDTGNVQLNGGTLAVTGPNSSSVFYSNLGAGSTVTFNGGTLASTFGANATFNAFNNFVVPVGQTGTFSMSARTLWGQAGTANPTHSLTGAGIFNVIANSTLPRDDLNVNLSAFTGTLNFSGTGGVRIQYNVQGAHFSPPTNATVDFSGSFFTTVTTNSGGNTFSMASLSGSSPLVVLGGGSVGVATYAWGLANNNTTFAGQVQGNAALLKQGTGKTIFSGQTLSYTGVTNINGGTWELDGLKTGAGLVNVNSGGTFSGTGTVSPTGGAVVVFAGGAISPGASVGTLTLNTVNFSNGATGTFEFNPTANDLLNVTGQLTLVGTTNLTLLAEGTSTLFADNGTYNLMQYGSLVGSVSSGLAIAPASQVAGKKYTFAASGNMITLTIGNNSTPNYWTKDLDGQVWNAAGNWSTGVIPDFAGAIAGFGTPGAVLSAPRSIALNGNRTVGQITFNDPQSVTLTGPANTITLDNAGAPGVITAINGNHTINAKVALTSAGAQVGATNAANTLTFSQAISGPSDGGINVMGAGTVVLGAPVTYGGPTVITSGTLRLAGGTDTLPNNVTPQITGTLDLNGMQQTFPSVSGPGVITNNAATDAVMTLTQDQSLSTNITDGLTNKTSVVFTGSNLTVTGAQSYKGGTMTTQNGITVTVANGAGLGTGPLYLRDGSNFTLSSGSTSLFNSTPVTVAPDSTIFVSATVLQSGMNGVFTFGNANSTVWVNGTTTSMAGAGQQFVGPGSLQIPSEGFLRFSTSTGLNNGGTQVTAHVDGTMTTRNAGTITLGALDGNGIVTRGIATNETTGSTLIYVIGSANIDDTFNGQFTGGDATHFQALTKAGTGTQTFTGLLNYAGATTINAGALKFGNGGSNQGAFPTGNVVTNSQWILNYGDDLDLSNAISGTGGINHQGPGQLTLRGNLTYTGNTTVAASTHVFVKSQLNAVGAAAGALTVGGSGATVQFDPSTYVAPAYKTVGTFGAISVGETGSGASTVSVLPIDRSVNRATVVVGNTLSIASDGGTGYVGFMDLGNSDLILKAGDLAATRAAVKAWYNGGSTTSTGLGASSANPLSSFTTLAVFANTTGTAGVGYYPNYDGVTGLTDTALIVKYTWVGDTNADGVLNAVDLANLIEGYSTGGTGWNNGDFNYDGVVNGLDFGMFTSAMSSVGSNSLGNGQGPSGNDGGQVPEPGSAGLAMLAAVPVLSRRRRR